MLRPYAIEEEGTLSRTPLVDMVDRGDRYNLRLEVPGIDKDKIQLNATEDSIEISGEQSEEGSTENKGNNYIYNERSYKSFYRHPNSRRNTSFEDHSKKEQWHSSNRDSKEGPRPTRWRRYKNRNRIETDDKYQLFFSYSVRY